MRIAESALDLIGLIYEAVEDPDGWPVFLDRLVRAMSATAAALHFQDLGSRAESVPVEVGFDPALAKAYVEHYHEVNILLKAGRAILDPRCDCYKPSNLRRLDVGAFRVSRGIPASARPFLGRWRNDRSQWRAVLLDVGLPAQARRSLSGVRDRLGGTAHAAPAARREVAAWP